MTAGFRHSSFCTGKWKRPSGRDTGRPLVRLPAPGLLRFRRDNLMLRRFGYPEVNVSQARLFYWKVATFLGATNHDEEPRRPKCLAPWPVLLKRPDVQRYPDDTRRAPAKPPAQPVGMAESDMNKSSWQKPAC